MLKDAAHIVGAHPDNLSTHLRKRGVVIPRRHPDTSLILPEKEIVASYLRGEGTPVLARRYGCAGMSIVHVLKKHGVKRRSQTEANRLLAEMRTKEQAREITRNARQKRHDNLRRASEKEAQTRYDVGMGYHLIADALSKKITVERQVGFLTYYLDLAFEHVAVEIEYSPQLGFYHQSLRLKKLIEADWFVVTLLHDGEQGLHRYLSKIISLLESACRNPPSTRHYRVIRCSFKRGVACNDYEYGAPICGSGHRAQIVYVCDDR